MYVFREKICMPGIKILIVAEDATAAIDIKRTLESLGHSVPYVASKMEEVVEKGLELLPDLILMDINFKGEINDVASVSQIQSLKIPAIFLTNSSKQININRTEFTEQYDYLTKPLDVIELKHKIELITCKKRFEKKLKKSEERFRSLFNYMASGVAIYSPVDSGNDFVFKDLNQAAEHIDNVRKADLLGKRITNVFPSVRDFGLLKVLKRVYETGKAERYPISLYQDDRISGWRDNFVYKLPSGEIVAVYEDVTERKKAEKELRKNEQFLENIIENIPDMIFVKSADELRFERINKAAERIWGYRREELVGKTDYDFFPKEEADFYTQNDREVLDKKELRDIPEETIHTKSMGTRILHTKKIPLLDEEGRSKYLLGISEDVTKHKLAERELKKSLDEKEALLKEIHHRVKNNMQIISSLLNLQSDYVQGDETKDVLKDSQSRVKTMAMIHEKLYTSSDLSHINFKEYTEKLVSDIFYTYGIQIGTIEPIFNIEDVEMNMETAIPLGLIINELVTNSLKFAFPDKKGSVTVELETEGDKHTLIVADDGVGLPEDFDFKNADSLGLELVNNLVKQIDGEITLDTSHGTKYEITFKELGYTERLKTS